MSIDPSHTPSPPPLTRWFNRLGVSGKLLVIGGAVGVIAAFLPFFSSSASGSGMRFSFSAMMIDPWQGKVCLAGYIAVIIMAWLLYVPAGVINKNLVWGLVGIAGLIAILSLWMFISVMRAGSTSGFGVSVGPGFGVFVNAGAAIAVTCGAFLKAREEKLL
jgi:hypothetical protein